MSSVSGVSPGVGEVYTPKPAAEAPPAETATAQKTQDLATEVTVSMMKLMMEQEKSVSKGILDLLA